MEARRYIPHYTIADYEQWEGDWELWNGVPVAMSPSPWARHQRVLLALAMQLQRQFDNNDASQCQTYVELDWRIADDTVVRPDLSVVCESLDGDFLIQPPSLIAEIRSPSTAEKDRSAKLDLYAAQSVRYYLIVDPDDQSSQAFRHHKQSYEPESGNPLTLPLHEACTITIDIESLLALE